MHLLYRDKVFLPFQLGGASSIDLLELLFWLGSISCRAYCDLWWMAQRVCRHVRYLVSYNILYLKYY